MSEPDPPTAVDDAAAESPDTLFLVPDDQPLRRCYGVSAADRTWWREPVAVAEPYQSGMPGLAQATTPLLTHRAVVQLTHPTGRVAILHVQHVTTDDTPVYVWPEITDDTLRLALVDAESLLLADVVLPILPEPPPVEPSPEPPPYTGGGPVPIPST